MGLELGHTMRTPRKTNSRQQDQLEAAAWMAGEGLELDNVKALGNRWSVRLSYNLGRGFEETCHQLYQWYDCCGATLVLPSGNVNM